MSIFLRHLRRDLLFVLAISGVLTMSALAQNAATPVKQVPAGSTATIGPANGAPPATPKTPQGKMLGSALSPKTRQTLQDAMDSEPSK